MSDETWLLSMLFGIFVVLPVGYCVLSWLSGNRNTPAGGGVRGDNIIRSDADSHPEYATQRAAEIVNQRLVGRNRGADMHVYVSTEQADEHSQRRHIDWMLENNRAASVGVHVHRVSPAERDERSAMRYRSTAWVNPPAEGFDPETGIIDGGKGICIEHTPGAGIGGCLQPVILLASIVFVGGSFFALLYCVNEILFPALGW